MEVVIGVRKITVTPMHLHESRVPFPRFTSEGSPDQHERDKIVGLGTLEGTLERGTTSRVNMRSKVVFDRGHSVDDHFFYYYVGGVTRNSPPIIKGVIDRCPC
jgi:hypothetical protein